jgi:DNA-binding transcriptional ArsR family regulator
LNSDVSANTKARIAAAIASSGKSEILQAITPLPDVHGAATLTEASLLSGTPKKEKAASASGGLLRTIGDFGILMCKDFGSVLSMPKETRGQALAALREVYDGEWTRYVGADGGRMLHWKGKVGLVAGVTPTIDRQTAVMGAMGERLVLFRLPAVDARAQGRKALKHAKRSVQMSAELGEAVAALFERQTAEPPERTEGDEERLVDLAALAVRCRSAVERDGYSREVELIPEPEAPARLAIVLDRLLDGLLTVGVDRDAAWSVVTSAALDSIPALRRRVMDTLMKAGSELKKSEVAEAIGYPPTTTERTLDDLVAHGIIDVHRYGQGTPTTWQISAWTVQNYAAATSPDLSGGHTPPQHIPDFSGEVDSATALELSANGVGGVAASEPAVDVEGDAYAERYNRDWWEGRWGR